MWLAASLPAVVRGQLRRRGCENLRRRRLRLGNRSYLQQLIEQKSGRWVWEAPKEGVCVVTLSVVPEGLAAASAAVEALTARLAAAH